MNQLLQMLFQQKMQQIPTGMMNQLENQLKRVNPQAFQEYQKARQNNENPNEFYNRTINAFNPQQKQQWNNMMNNLTHQQQNGINTQKSEDINK